MKNQFDEKLWKLIKHDYETENNLPFFLLLDVFLSCIAKSLTLQVKSKLNKDSGTSAAAGSSGGSLGGGPAKTHMMTVNLASSIHPRDPTGKVRIL